MTISTFDPNTLKGLGQEIDAALKAVAAKHGITLTMKTMRYDFSGTTFTASLEGKAASFGDAAKAKAISMAKVLCGVDASQPCTHPKLIGAVLTEYRDRARKAPWVYEFQGKTYICSDNNMRLMFPKVAEVAPDLATGRGVGAVEVDDLIQREVAPPTGLSH